MFLSHSPVSIALISSLLIGKVWARPHRDSHFAYNYLGWIGRTLVKPPSEIRAFYELGSGKLDSVSSLSPTQPKLQILPDLPLGYSVRPHSIIADQGIEGELEESSDGIVHYWSSHLDDVESEEIVPSEHSATRDPETIKEVKRILRLRQGPILPITFRGDTRLNPACVSGKFSRLSHL